MLKKIGHFRCKFNNYEANFHSYIKLNGPISTCILIMKTIYFHSYKLDTESPFVLCMLRKDLKNLDRTVGHQPQAKTLKATKCHFQLVINIKKPRIYFSLISSITHFNCNVTLGGVGMIHRQLSSPLRCIG